MTFIKNMAASIGAIGCAIVLFVALLFGAGAVSLVYLNTFGVAQQNVQRTITQQSLQYVQAHQQILMTYWSNYQTGDANQKATNQTLICEQAPLLDQSQWPTQISAFVAQHCH